MISSEKNENTKKKNPLMAIDESVNKANSIKIESSTSHGLPSEQKSAKLHGSFRQYGTRSQGMLGDFFSSNNSCIHSGMLMLYTT